MSDIYVIKAAVYIALLQKRRNPLLLFYTFNHSIIIEQIWASFSWLIRNWLRY